MVFAAFPAMAKYEPWPPQKWPPFSWPDAYTVTAHESSMSKGGAPETSVYRRDDDHARIDIGGPLNTREVQIFWMEEHRKISYQPGGPVQESALPENWRMTQFYPDGDQWEALGVDPLNGKKSLKYKIWRNPQEAEKLGLAPHALFWLSTDHKTPLRLIDGDRRVDFTDYAEGAQDEALFEAPAAK